MKVKDGFKKTVKKVKDLFLKVDEEEEEEKKLIGFRLFEVIILVVISTVVGVFSGGFLTYNFASNNGERSINNSKYVNEFEEAFDSVVDNYYEDVDKDELIDAAINGMLSVLDDYTSYMDAEENKQFNERLNGEYQGIGIEFITYQNEGYEHRITGVFEGTPAAVAGVQKDDIIVKIDNIDVSTKTGTEIATYIKSSNIEKITMVVKRNNENITLQIKKSVISLPSIIKKTFEKNGKKVGYINISLFADNTYTQFKNALTALEAEGINSLVIDVRDNSGGYLHIADNILELFMNEGDLLYKTQGKLGVREYKDETGEKRTYDVAVLINDNSASASEILAAAFKETYGSQIIGTTSFGKGTVQQPTDLDNGGMIKVTTEKWLTPNGNWIDKKGIAPTIEIELGTDYSANPIDDNDNQLQKALETLTK